MFLLAALYTALQTETFQTWAAKKATTYLSKELHAKIQIDRLKISFISNVTLQGVFVSDAHQDTLIYGKSITLNLSHFDYKKQKLRLDELELSDVKVKLLKYKNEKDWNFQFLANYFAPKDSIKKDTIPSKWKITYGALKLNNVDFTYHLLRDTAKIASNMNFNNIHVSQLFGTITEFNIHGDTIFSQIANLSAKEQCGMELKNLSTKARVSSTELKCDSIYLKTAHSLVKGNLTFKYEDWIDYQDFINKVYIKSNLKDSTYLNFKDVAYFTEDLNGFQEVLYLKGNVRGFVNDLSGSDMNIKYRHHTQFIGDIGITGLPDITKSYIHFNAKKLSTSIVDLEKFPLPPFNNPSHLKIPVALKQLGEASYVGKFDGFVNDFATYGIFKTKIGIVKTDLHINNTNKKLEYSGNITTTNLELSKLFPEIKLLGPLSAAAKVKGKGISIEELDVKFEGIVQSIVYNNYQYSNINLDGSFAKKIFTGNVVSRDTNANFTFNGTIDMSSKATKMDFISTINLFDLEKTNFATSQLNGKLSSQILINLNGTSLDNISGLINFDNTIYKTKDTTFKVSTFNLELDQATSIKKILLNSNIANIQLKGQYNLSTIPDAFKQYLNGYFPTFFKTQSQRIFNDKAELSIKIKNFTSVKKLFAKDLMISSGSTIDGSFDASINYLNLTSNSNLIEYLGIKFKENVIGINSLSNGIALTYTAKKIQMADSLSFNNSEIALTANDRTTNFNLHWDNLSKPNHAGMLSGSASFNNSKAIILFDKMKYTIKDSIWQIVKSNPITIDTSYSIDIKPLTFYNQNQLITIDGKLSKRRDDKLNIFIQNFKLAQLNPFLKKSNVSIDGIFTGNTSILSAFNKPVITSDIAFSDFKLNNKLIGKGEIVAEFNPEKEVVRVNGFSAFGNDLDGNLLKNIEFDGYYYPKKKEDNLNITFKTQPFDLTLLQPLLKDILTFKMGYLNGNGKITGTPEKPEINAKLNFFKCIVVVDFLNVQYSINGVVDIMPKQIRFEKLNIQDKFGNLGKIDGNIFHSNFQDMRIDFDVNTNKLMVLNTTSANNPSYYGTAYATGNAGIYGFINDINMEINMKTNRGTYFYIPLDGPSEISNNDFIKFVTKDTIAKVVKKEKSNFSLDLNLDVTREAEVQLIFDEKSGDVIKARGDGLLNMKIDSKGKFNMFGDYVLTTGDYLFTLEDFVTKKFEIQKGSSIKWNGNVYKANIDIVANYVQRASIKPLFPNDPNNNYNKRFLVECKLFMKEKLTAPVITLGIELPTIDETSRSAIKSTLSDESELKRQWFSLLLLRSFVTPISLSGSGGISAGQAAGGAAVTGSEMLSNKVSNWLNGVTKDIDIGVNYKPGSALNNEELDLALSKQLFSNRLSIDGNFGLMNGNTTNANKSTNTSNLIGDVTLEYKLTESGKYRVKGFNRSNDNVDITFNGGPFTQGVGIFYREEYEKLSELYKRYLAKFKKKEGKK